MAALAIYGSKISQGATEAEAFDYLKPWFQNSQHQPSTSRDATDQFLAGMGDVLIHFEAASFRNHEENGLRKIYPAYTLMTEPIAVALKKNISQDQAEIVDAFVTFLWSEHVQKLLLEHGFRSQLYLDELEQDSLTGIKVFTLDYLGDPADLIHNVIDPLLSR